MTLTDVDLRAVQLQHTQSLELELFSGKLLESFPLQKLVPVMQEPDASKESVGRALLLGDLSPAGSVTLCWGLPDSALSSAASRQSHSAEEGEIMPLESKYNLLCLAGLRSPGAALRATVL